MIKLISKLAIVFIIGYLLGWILGGIIGAFVGAIPGLFFREIIYANQTFVTSLILVISIGGLVGFLAVKIINKFSDTNDHVLIGVLAGIVIALFGIFFRYGLLINAEEYLSIPRFSLFPVFFGTLVGNYVGSGTFVILGIVRVFRDRYEEVNNGKSNKERLDRIKESLK